jgi:predicted DCC family thiol-disulfide oxidoreductase YuxK
MAPEELAKDVRLLLIDGRHLRGADVYRHVMRRIWWATPLYVIASLPILRNLFDAAYRVFADNRYWISRTCHLPAKPPVSTHPPA